MKNLKKTIEECRFKISKDLNFQINMNISMYVRTRNSVIKFAVMFRGMIYHHIQKEFMLLKK